MNSTEEEILERHVDMLAEHFDNVQIFVSSHDRATGDTVRLDCACGNYLANLAAVLLWAMREINTKTRD